MCSFAVAFQRVNCCRLLNVVTVDVYIVTTAASPAQKLILRRLNLLYEGLGSAYKPRADLLRAVSSHNSAR